VTLSGPGTPTARGAPIRPSALGAGYLLIAAATAVVGAAGWAYDPTPAPRSWGASLSADGRTLAFTSPTSNLVPGDTNGAPDVFVKDLRTGATTRASTAADGRQTGGALYPVLSADGSRVAFLSVAPDLVAGDTNGERDVFVKDLRTGAVTRASTTAAGAEVHGAGGAGPVSTHPTWLPGRRPAGCPGSYAFPTLGLSADGTRVAFVSAATDLVPGDTNRCPDVFVKDLRTGAVTRASTTARGGQVRVGASDSGIALSADGSTVAFVSVATDLTPDPVAGKYSLFVKNVRTGAIRRIANVGAAAEPSLSADGRTVAFLSKDRLAPGDRNRAADGYVRDVWTGGAFTRASTTARGARPERGAGEPALSADGTCVAFSTTSRALVGDTQDRSDVYLRDLRTGTLRRASVTAAGTDFGLEAGRPAVSADCGGVAMHVGENVYVKDMASGTLVRATRLPDDRPFVAKVWTQLRHGG
jgi:Tol biopolymer transport system component